MTVKCMRLLTALAAGALVAGCATISSQDVGPGNVLDTARPPCDDAPASSTVRCRPREFGDGAAQPGAPGIAYFLPRQLARVTAIRTNIKLDEKIKAVSEARAAVEAAQAAIDAANAVIHQTEEAIIAGSGGDAAQPILASRLTAQRAELATATLALPVKTTALERAKAELRDAANQPTAASPPPANTNPPANPEPAYRVALKIELLPPSADPALAYRLNPHHSAFRDDEHKLVVSSAGLLTSTDVVAVDRTPDILVEIATFAGAIIGGPLPIRSARANQPIEADRCRSAPSEFTGIVDFADPASVATLNEDLQCLGVRAQVIGRRWPETTRPAATSSQGVDGIVYRTPVEVLVRIEKCIDRNGACTPTSPSWFPTEVIALSLPQAGPISYVRQDAGFMTRTRYTLAFRDGILTNYDASRPSEVLEAVRTPMRLFQGVADGVSKIFSLRTGQNNAQLALVQSQGTLGTGGNTVAAQVSASNLALTASLLRDQARRDALSRCVAQQVGLGQPIDSCLVGF